MSLHTTTQSPVEIDAGFAPADFLVDTARLLLESLARAQRDPIERLVLICALGHLEAVDPPRRPLPDPGAEDRVQRDDAVEALVDVVRRHDVPAERTRAALALHELATPLNPFGDVL